MSIRCGHCHETHETVAGVRKCAEREYRRATPRRTVEPDEDYVRPIDRMTIPNRRDQEEREWEERVHGTEDKRQPSGIIRDLSSRLPTEDGHPIPRIRVAVEHEGTLKFYQIDRPQTGNWAGWTFVKVQASDDLYPVKNPGTIIDILELVAADPQEAMLRYGREIGACGHCGRTLTKSTSRELGIGPICRHKVQF